MKRAAVRGSGVTRVAFGAAAEILSTLALGLLGVLICLVVAKIAG